jgi:sulfate permease, SulP family
VAQPTGTLRGLPAAVAGVLPGLSMLRHYPRRWLRQDAFVGVAVAAYLVPQVLAYSGLVGVPAVVGLWGAVAAMAVYWLFGSSRVLAIGPESTVALMAGSVVAQLSDGDPARSIALSAGLALVVGAWLFLAWLLRLGVVADLLSHPLLVGYLSGGAVLMVVGQLGRVTGIEVSGTSIVEQVRSFVSQVGTGAGNLPTLLIALATLAILFGVSAWRRTAPAPLIAVAAATLASALLGLSERGVAVLGEVPQGLPSPTLPALSWSDVSALALAGLGVAVVAYSDNTLIGRAFARRGESFDANQELLALSAVHVGVGAFSAYPVSSSGTRTALAVSGGARTQVYSIVAMLVVLAMLLVAGPLVRDLPDAALGAVVIFAARTLVSIPDYRELWRYRPSEFALALVTLVGTVWLGILAGVGIAVVLSLLEMTTRLSRPHDAIQGFVPDRGPGRAWPPTRRARSGVEPATMPQPARSRTSSPLEASTAGAAQRDAELAVAVPVDPADRPGVAAAVHALELADHRQRALGRRPAHGGRRVQRRGEGQHRGPSASRPVTSVARCCTLASSSTCGRAGTSRSVQCAASALATECTAYSCSSGPCPRRAARGRGRRRCGASPRRRTVPASTRLVTRSPVRRTSSSGVAPSRPSTLNVQQDGYAAASRSSRWRGSSRAVDVRHDVAGEHHLVELPGP